MFAWQFAWLVEKYYNFEVNVVTSVSTVATLPFPTISLCNLNPFQRSALPKVSLRCALKTLIMNKGRNDVVPADETGRPKLTENYIQGVSIVLIPGIRSGRICAFDGRGCRKEFLGGHAGQLQQQQ